MIEDTILKYEEKHAKENYFDDENRRKKVEDRKQLLKDTLRD